jgi:hypothetical protein
MEFLIRRATQWREPFKLEELHDEERTPWPASPAVTGA